MSDVMCSCDGPPHTYDPAWCGPAPKRARNSGYVSCPPTDTGFVTRPAPEAREESTVCAWCPSTATEMRAHNDGVHYPSCGSLGHGLTSPTPRLLAPEAREVTDAEVKAAARSLFALSGSDAQGFDDLRPWEVEDLNRHARAALEAAAAVTDG